MTLRGVRWWIVLMISFGTIINYLSRNTLGILAPTLMSAMDFTTQQYSYVVGAFQLAYTVMQPVGGYMLDLLGARLGFTLFAILWSIAGCLHAFAGGWVSLAASRFCLGLGEAAAIPAGVKAISEWFPAKERSVAMGLFNVGTSLGAMLAPPLVFWVQSVYDWRGAFLITGGLGFLFAALWWFCYRSPPEVSATKPIGGPPLRDLLHSRRFWGIALPRFLAEPAWQTFSFWIPLFLYRERGMNLAEIALFAWLPFLAADLGGVAGGFLSPLVMRLFGTKLVPARLTGMVLGAICMLGPACIGLAAGPAAAILLLCLGGFAHQMISTTINALSSDVFPSHTVGTASGFAGMAAWTGGLGFSLVVGGLVDRIGFAPFFVCLWVFDILAALAAIILLKDQAPVGAQNNA